MVIWPCEFGIEDGKGDSFLVADAFQDAIHDLVSPLLFFLGGLHFVYMVLQGLCFEPQRQVLEVAKVLRFGDCIVVGLHSRQPIAGLL